MTRPTDISPSVAALIFDRERRLLLSQRLGDRNESGAWQTPGGWIERSDWNIVDAAQREAFEESNLVLHSGTILFSSLHSTGLGFSYVTVWVACFHWSGEPTQNEPDKHDPWGWYDVDDLPQPLVPGTLKAALMALERRHETPIPCVDVVRVEASGERRELADLTLPEELGSP